MPHEHEMHYLSERQVALVEQSIALSPDRSIVLLDVAGLRDIPVSEHNRNLYCIGSDGAVFWQVHDETCADRRDSFVALWRDSEGKVRADRFFGNEYLIHPDSGVAEHVGWHK